MFQYKKTTLREEGNVSLLSVAAAIEKENKKGFTLKYWYRMKEQKPVWVNDRQIRLQNFEVANIILQKEAA